LTRITVPDTNPVPVKVSEAVAPANAWLGLAVLSTGTGFVCPHAGHATADIRISRRKETLARAIATKAEIPLELEL
jgi:hypothetical protein